MEAINMNDFLDANERFLRETGNFTIEPLSGNVIKKNKRHVTSVAEQEAIQQLVDNQGYTYKINQ